MHTEAHRGGIYAAKYPAGISVFPSTEKMDGCIKYSEREREIFNKNLNTY